MHIRYLKMGILSLPFLGLDPKKTIKHGCTIKYDTGHHHVVYN